MFEYGLIVLVAVGLFMLFYWMTKTGIDNDKKEWNNGKCPLCGNQYELFDMDSQGGRGYVCRNCKKYIWISYNVDNYH